MTKPERIGMVATGPLQMLLTAARAIPGVGAGLPGSWFILDGDVVHG
jgi:hypothetical protein